MLEVPLSEQLTDHMEDLAIGMEDGNSRPKYTMPQKESSQLQDVLHMAKIC